MFDRLKNPHLVAFLMLAISSAMTGGILPFGEMGHKVAAWLLTVIGGFGTYFVDRSANAGSPKDRGSVALPLLLALLGAAILMAACEGVALADVIPKRGPALHYPFVAILLAVGVAMGIAGIAAGRSARKARIGRGLLALAILCAASPAIAQTAPPILAGVAHEPGPNERRMVIGYEITHPRGDGIVVAMADDPPATAERPAATANAVAAPAPSTGTDPAPAAPSPAVEAAKVIAAVGPSLLSADDKVAAEQCRACAVRLSNGWWKSPGTIIATVGMLLVGGASAGLQIWQASK